MSFVGFIDITGTDANLAPLVKGDVRAYYATGTNGIEETAAQVAAAKAAGMGVILIDQTPTLSVFAAGWADVADIEAFAGTIAEAVLAVKARSARGWASTLYCSYSTLPSLRAAIGSLPNVFYWVADYSWSQAEAETLLSQNADWVAVQYGDPASNPNTLVPGTNVTLSQCNADIDVAKSSWTDQFLPAPPVTPPPPPPLPVWPLPSKLSDVTRAVTVEIAWTPVTGASLYQYQVEDAKTGAVIVADNRVVSPSALLTDLPVGGSYKWRMAVPASATHQASPWSEWQTFTT